MDASVEAQLQSEQARERLRELSGEIARRVSVDELRLLANEQREHLEAYASEKTEQLAAKAKDLANEKVSELKEKMSEIKESTTEEARDKLNELKELAVNKTHEMRERAATSPRLLGAIGGILGAQIGAWIARERYLASSSGMRASTAGSFQRGLGDRIAGETGAVGAAARDIAGDVSQTAETVTQKVGDSVASARESVGHAVESIREKIPSAHEVKDKVSNVYHRAVTNYPWALALGAVGFGILASMLLPESETEKRSFADMKQRAREGLGRIGSDVEEKIISGASALGHVGQHEEDDDGPSSSRPDEEEPATLH